MNDNPTPNVLPSLSEQTIDAMEENIFHRIAEDRTQRHERAKRGRIRTIGWSAAAAVVVVAGAAVVPGLVSGAATSSPASDEAGAVSYDHAGARQDGANGGAAPEIAPMSGESLMSGSDADAGAKSAGGSADAQVIENANISLRVGDITVAATEVADIATGLSGYVSSQNIGTNNLDETAKLATTAPNYGWVTIRVPKSSLQDAISKITPLGEVQSSSIDRMDVTQQSVDLNARVESLTASVKRLEELMSQSASVPDLIAAESALSQRQADLESLQQQLDSLNDQVAMSSVSISLEQKSVVKADPVGFGDGITNGWNSIIAVFNALIIAAGFVLPWLIPVAVIVLIVWIIARSRKRKRKADA